MLPVALIASSALSKVEMVCAHCSPSMLNCTGNTDVYTGVQLCSGSAARPQVQNLQLMCRGLPCRCSRLLSGLNVLLTSKLRCRQALIAAHAGCLDLMWELCLENVINEHAAFRRRTRTGAAARPRTRGLSPGAVACSCLMFVDCYLPFRLASMVQWSNETHGKAKPLWCH